MKKLVNFIFVGVGLLNAQNQLIIPETLSGNEFNLTLQNGTTQLFDGMATQTMGANGDNLAPTLIFQKGEYVNINVTNNLEEETTIHWHGMHVSPENESGRKDVVLVKQMETVRFIAKFEDFADDEVPYMYHCHMLQHEDDGLMGQFIVEGQDILFGDVNFDNIINILDVNATVGHILSNNTFNEEQLVVADLNQDGIVNIIDILQLLQYIIYQ